jgi:hypothetical protein
VSLDKARFWIDATDRSSLIDVLALDAAMNMLDRELGQITDGRIREELHAALKLKIYPGMLSARASPSPQVLCSPSSLTQPDAEAPGWAGGWGWSVAACEGRAAGEIVAFSVEEYMEERTRQWRLSRPLPPPREPTPGVARPGSPRILGALDKSIIDRIVKQNLPQIRYCYQQELNKNPKLFGKLVVKFVIAKDGSVSSASTKASTLKNPIVEQCVNSRFRRMRFPKPKGGGIVIVSYPFVFNSQG